MRLVQLCALALLLSVPAVAADTGASADDCYGLTTGATFTGYCGVAPDCMEIYVYSAHLATVGCR